MQAPELFGVTIGESMTMNPVVVNDEDLIAEFRDRGVGFAARSPEVMVVDRFPQKRISKVFKVEVMEEGGREVE